MVMPVYDDLEAVSVLGMLSSKNDGEGIIIMKDVANQMKVAYVNAKNNVLKSVWPETKGNIVENSVFLTRAFCTIQKGMRFSGIISSRMGIFRVVRITRWAKRGILLKA